MNEGSVRGRKYLIIVILASILVILGVAAVVWLSGQRSDQVNTRQELSAIEKQFYGALGNGAKQQKLRVGMYRETFANKADAEARKNIGKVASSVSEVDTEAGKYRSVFAHNLLNDDDSFKVGRCIDGKTYNDYYQPPATRTEKAKTLQDAATRLYLMPQGNLYEVTQPLVFISCPRLGLLPSNPPIVEARLSDGVFPVTLSDQQAKNWQAKVEEARLFDVQDEGVVERNGTKLKKISFSPKNKKDDRLNKRLYDIFYETGEIAKIKSEQPNAEVDYEFQPIRVNDYGAVEGFYLVDETTNLPVYSELWGLYDDKKTGESRTADQNIVRTKQSYMYPAQLTLGLDTRLEFLN